MLFLRDIYSCFFEEYSETLWEHSILVCLLGGNSAFVFFAYCYLYIISESNVGLHQWFTDIDIGSIPKIKNALFSVKYGFLVYSR